MKQLLILMLALILCLSLSGCDNDNSEIALESDNILDYVNIQLVFGNVEQIIYEPEDDDSNSFPSFISSDRYLSCMCYIYVTPKADYKFENASLTFTIPKKQSSSSGFYVWTIDSGKTIPGLTTDKCEQTINLDKDGYGVGSIRFSKTGDTGHPLSTDEDWKVEIKDAAGKVIE